MRNLFRSRYFWAGALLFSVLCALFSVHYYPQVFSIVRLDIAMDRHDALQKARELTQQYQIGPQQFQQATAFQTDYTVKTYVEREAGGQEAFMKMIDEHWYEPYTWNVRHFQEYNPHETTIIFTPSGKPYGFVEKLSENDTGNNVDTQAAKDIGHESAQQLWNINFEEYRLIETSQEKQPSERIDHTFVYERTDRKLGDGEYRLRIVVSGDKCTTVIPFIKVPEDFIRRYQEMRSTNNTISWAANLFFMIVYFFGFAICGLIFLFKKRFVLWRPAIYLGISIALLKLLAHINQLPLYWMQYDTLLSKQSFLLSLLVAFFSSFIRSSILYSTAIMAAEGLTRYIFGSHIQFWKTLKTGVANSRVVFGRIIGGYLLMTIEMATLILFYGITTHYFGWWNPSQSLFDPSVLATYLPWLSAIAPSFEAGIIEECLFRAVPLATALLLAQRFGKKKWWLIAALIIQAIIFGAAHANYPAQPAYARIVELAFFSFISAFVYLRFGLIPIIISHFAYDVVLFALPLFVAQTPSAYLNQAIVILLALTPLWIALRARWKYGSWKELDQKDTNSHWQPPAVIPKKPKKEIVTTKARLSDKHYFGMLLLGVSGFICWYLFTPFDQQAPQITVSRKEATKIAHNYMIDRGIELSSDWTPLTYFIADYNSHKIEHTFIWQEGERHTYRELMSKNYLQPPRWVVRFARFVGSAIERAEEYVVVINPDGTITRFKHTLAESTPGENLEKQEARTLAHNRLQNIYKIDLDTVQELSASSCKQPNRTDWTFTFANPTDYPLDTGQARIVITISGNNVTDYYQYIHVPEEWSRDQKHTDTIINTLASLCTIFGLLLLVFGTVFILARQTTGFVSRRSLLQTIGLFLTLYIMNILNNYPLIVAHFNTSEPFYNQLFRAMSALGFQAIVRSIIFALTFLFIRQLKTERSFPKTITNFLSATGMGLFIAGIESLIRALLPSLRPLWATYAPLTTLKPLHAAGFSILYTYLIITVAKILFVALLNTCLKGKNIYILIFPLSICFTLFLYSTQTIDSLSHWGIISTTVGSAFAVLYCFIVRIDYALIPPLVAGQVILHGIQQAIFNIYPNQALFIGIFNTCMVLIIAYGLFVEINRPVDQCT